jgi:hypothetical protein
MPWSEYTNRIVDERVTLHKHGDFTNHQIMGLKSGKGTGDKEFIIKSGFILFSIVVSTMSCTRLLKII